MSQTTTNVGRLSVADPDLGFDTNDGGTALQAQLRTNVTKFSDHLIARYATTTLANTASTTITHNFGLNLTKLKVLIWESGVLRTDAQVAADYTIAESGGSSTTAIVITNASGGSKTFKVVVLGMKLGINSSDFDPAVSIDTSGNVRAAELRTTGEDLVLNHDAAASGADWKGTVRRPSSGMTAAAVWTMPLSTTTIVGTDVQATLTAKDYQGGTASDLSRLRVPRAAIATLTGLTRQEGITAYATDASEDRLYHDDGTSLLPVTGRKVTGTSSAATAITAGGGITPAGVWDELIYVAGSGGVDITANPQIVAGTKSGQRLTLVGTHATNTVTLDDGTGLALNGTCVLGTDRSIGQANVLNLFWDSAASVWKEESRS